jgi:hypothetical protein
MAALSPIHDVTGRRQVGKLNLIMRYLWDTQGFLAQCSVGGVDQLTIYSRLNNSHLITKQYIGNPMLIVGFKKSLTHF